MDLAAREVRVARAVSDDGKRIDTPKNGHGRTVDLSQQLTRALREHLTAVKAEALRQGLPMSPWLFRSATGTVLDQRNVRRAFARASSRPPVSRSTTRPTTSGTPTRACYCKPA